MSAEDPNLSDDPAQDDPAGGSGGDGGDSGSGGSGDESAPESRQYALQQQVSTIGNASANAPSVTIDDTTIEAVSQLKVAGSGRKTQWLSESASGGSGGGDTPSDTAEGEQGDDAESGGEGTDGAGSGTGSGEDNQTPPLTLTITCRLGTDTYGTLEELRDATEPFDVSVGDLVSLDQMELVDLQRTHTADQPGSYGATIKVREYRETTLRVPSGGGGGGDRTDPGQTEGDAGDTTTGGQYEDQEGGVSEPAGEFETVEVPAGEVRQVSVGEGERITNQLYDISADGAGVQINAQGNGWSIEHIGVRGQHPGGHYAIVASVPADGQATIDNVYLGDGQQPRTRGGGLFLRGDGENPHQGVVSASRLHMAQLVSTGVHAAGPASQGHSGKIDIQNSLFDANNIANIRVATTGEQTTYLRNVVSAAMASTPACGQACSDPGATRTRGLWTEGGETVVINSDIHGDVQTSGGGTHSFQDSRRDENADTGRVPAGVPLTPEAAAGGGN